MNGKKGSRNWTGPGRLSVIDGKSQKANQESSGLVLHEGVVIGIGRPEKKVGGRGRKREYDTEEG